MTNAILLIAWPSGDQVLTSFRWATGYGMPGAYSGDAKLTQIASSVNGSTFELLFRCQGCFSWDQGGNTGSVSTTGGTLVLGYGLAPTIPTNPTCPSTMRMRQHTAFGQWGAQLSGTNQAAYADWAKLATKEVTGDCGTPTTTSSTTTASATAGPTPTAACPAASSEEYDYIIVGAGAGKSSVPIPSRGASAQITDPRRPRRHSRGRPSERERPQGPPHRKGPAVFGPVQRHHEAGLAEGHQPDAF